LSIVNRWPATLILAQSPIPIKKLYVQTDARAKESSFTVLTYKKNLI